MSKKSQNPRKASQSAGRSRPVIEAPVDEIKYRGYTIYDKTDYFAITYDNGVIGCGNTEAECRTIIDGEICKRKAALAKKMGRSENDPNALI